MLCINYGKNLALLNSLEPGASFLLFLYISCSKQLQQT